MLMCVNCGLPARSTIAQTPGAVVCSRSLTLMYPRSVTSTPVSSRPSPSTFGLRPVATNVESPALYENIGKHFVAVGACAVVHSIAGGEKHPFASRRAG